MPNATTSTSDRRGYPTHVPVRQLRARSRAKVTDARHLDTAIAMSLNTHHESAEDLQWAIDRLDLDRARTSFAREERSRARHRLVFAMRVLGVPPREAGSPSTYKAVAA